MHDDATVSELDSQLRMMDFIKQHEMFFRTHLTSMTYQVDIDHLSAEAGVATAEAFAAMAGLELESDHESVWCEKDFGNGFTVIVNFTLPEPMGESTELSGGQLLRHHTAAQCEKPCALHAPSPHHLADLPLWWNGSALTRVCEHGGTHRDPDDITHAIRATARNQGAKAAFDLLSENLMERLSCACGCCLTRPQKAGSQS